MGLRLKRRKGERIVLTDTKDPARRLELEVLSIQKDQGRGSVELLFTDPSHEFTIYREELLKAGTVPGSEAR